jgi:hypothetical protein
VTESLRSLGRWFVSLRGAWWTIVVGSVACGGGSERSRTPDSATATSVAPAPVTAAADSSKPAANPLPGPATTGTTGCVSEGDWQRCSIEKRLTDAGFVPIKKGPAPTGIFPVEGTTYTLGSAELHVYVFSSAKAREQAVGAIDTATVSRRGATPQAWQMPPALIVSNNLAAVLVSDNARQVERVQNAIRAGLPAATH